MIDFMEIIITQEMVNSWKTERVEITRQIQKLKDRQRLLDALIAGYFTFKQVEKSETAAASDTL